MRRHLDPDEWADQRGHIFALYTDLGITTEEERHHLQHALTGCSSLRYMSREEHLKLVDTLEKLVEKSYAERNHVLNGLLALSSFDYQSFGTKGDL